MAEKETFAEFLKRVRENKRTRLREAKTRLAFLRQHGFDATPGRMHDDVVIVLGIIAALKRKIRWTDDAIKILEGSVGQAPPYKNAEALSPSTLPTLHQAAENAPRGDNKGEMISRVFSPQPEDVEPPEDGRRLP